MLSLLLGVSTAFGLNPNDIRARVFIDGRPGPDQMRSWATFQERADKDIGLLPFLIVPTGWEQPVTWKYTFSTPTDRWARPDFDDSGWQTGPAAFCDNPVRPEFRTRWTGADIWMRRAVELKITNPNEIIFWGKWDDNVEVFWDGQKVADSNGVVGTYRFLPLLPEAKDSFRGGTGVLAVHCHNNGGPGFIDMGIARNPWFTGFIRTGIESHPRLLVYANLVLNFMKKYQVPAGEVTLQYKDKIVADWGFGWADKRMTAPVYPGTIFRLASVDKVVTKIAFTQLRLKNVKIKPTGKRLDVSTKVFPTLRAYGIHPQPGKPIDPRLNDVTIAHLLDHTSGIRYLPNPQDLYRDLGITRWATPADNARWLMTQPLLWTPGTKGEYNSINFHLLRLLMQLITGNFYRFMQEEIFHPADWDEVGIDSEELAGRGRREIWYATDQMPGDWYVDLENVYAVSASTRAMTRLLRRYHLGTGETMFNNRTRLWQPSDNGGGVFYGGMPGTSTVVEQRRWDEINFAIFFNRGSPLNSLHDAFMQKIDTTPRSFWDQLKEIRMIKR